MKRITLEEEFEKNPEDLRKEDIEALQEWIKTQPHLPKIEDRQIVLFLHSNYYNVEKTKETIENYYTMRTRFTELFSDRYLNSEELLEAREVINVAVLPGKTKDGYNVCYMRLNNTDAWLSTQENNVKLFLMMVDTWLLEHGTHKGIIMVCDMEGISWSHIMKTSYKLNKLQTAYYHEAIPVRLKSLVYLNVQGFMQKLMTWVRPLIKDEVFNLIRFTTKLEEVYDLIPPEMFPKDMPGGKGPSFKELHEEFNRKLLANQVFFMDEDLKYRVDESKRVEAPSSFWNIFG